MSTRHHQELSDLDATLQLVSESAAAEHFGVSLMRDSLLRRRDEVVAEAAGVLDLGLAGEDLSATGSEVTLVARVLESLQESLASIAQVLAGEPTSRGLIPGAIKDSVQLRVALATPGSLHLRLVPASATHESDVQLSLPEQSSAPGEGEETPWPLLDQSIDRLIGLLGYSQDEKTDLLQDIADVGPRATSHLHHLSKTLSEAGAGAALSWRSSYVRAETTISSQEARRLTSTLEEVSEDSREVVYTGRLVGGSLVHRTFELELEGDGNSLVAGKASEDALPDLQRLFGQSCTAHIQVREAQLTSGETRESHTLTRLSE